MDEIIEVEEEVVVVEVEETPIGGINLSTKNHAELDNLDLEDQHPIKAVIGLKSILDEIQKPKEVQRAYAEYHMWNDISPDYKVGRFVSLVAGTDTIEFVNENNYNIFGVTVPNDNIAIVVNEEWNTIKDEKTNDIIRYESTRDFKYGLVCFEGNVKVYYKYDSENPIAVGDYVKPGVGIYAGYAVKNEDADGYYRVISVGSDLDGGNFVIINLSLSASDIDNISVKHAKTTDDYTEDGSIKSEFDNVHQEASRIEEKFDGEVDRIETKFDEEINRIEEKFDGENSKIDGEINDIIDGTTVVKNATNAENYTYFDEKKNEVIIKNIKEEFNNISNGLTPAATLQNGVLKNDFNFIAEKDIIDENGNTINKGKWHPNPCGNYYGNKKVEIELNTGEIVTLTTWQLKGFWLQNNDYMQILIGNTTETDDEDKEIINPKIFMRRLYGAGGFVASIDKFIQIAGEGTTVDLANSATNDGDLNEISTTYAKIADLKKKSTEDGHITVYKATRAECDENGYNISNYYAKDSTVRILSNNIDKKSGVYQDPTTDDNNKKVYPVGTIATWYCDESSISFKIGVSVYVKATNSYGIPFCWVESADESDVAGAWIICGLASQGAANDSGYYRNVYIIQRIS